MLYDLESHAKDGRCGLSRNGDIRRFEDKLVEKQTLILFFGNMTCKYYHCMYAVRLCMNTADFHTISVFLFLSTISRGDKYGSKWSKNNARKWGPF